MVVGMHKSICWVLEYVVECVWVVRVAANRLTASTPNKLTFTYIGGESAYPMMGHCFVTCFQRICRCSAWHFWESMAEVTSVVPPVSLRECQAPQNMLICVIAHGLALWVYAAGLPVLWLARPEKQGWSLYVRSCWRGSSEDVVLDLHEIWFPLDRIGPRFPCVHTTSISFIASAWEHWTSVSQRCLPGVYGPTALLRCEKRSTFSAANTVATTSFRFERGTYVPGLSVSQLLADEAMCWHLCNSAALSHVSDSSHCMASCYHRMIWWVRNVRHQHIDTIIYSLLHCCPVPRDVISHQLSDGIHRLRTFRKEFRHVGDESVEPSNAFRVSRWPYCFNGIDLLCFGFQLVVYYQVPAVWCSTYSAGQPDPTSRNRCTRACSFMPWSATASSSSSKYDTPSQLKIWCRRLI